MTEPLFRFLLLRPPIAQDPAVGSIALAQSTDFQIKLATAASSPNPRRALVDASTTFIASPKFISSASASAFQKQVNTLSAIFDKFEDAGIFDLKAVAGAVKQVFDHDASTVAKGADFIALVEALKDSITAIRFVQEEHIRPVAALIDQLRDLEFIQKAADSAPPPANLILGGITSSDVPNAWDSDARYAPADCVVYEDEVYKCTAAHRSHPRLSPPDTPQLWSLVPSPAVITDQALLLTLNDLPTPWKEGVNYNIGDRVRYLRIIYMCLQAHRSQRDWTPRRGRRMRERGWHGQVLSDLTRTGASKSWSLQALEAMSRLVVSLATVTWKTVWSHTRRELEGR